jgi:hypothetical protein
MTAPVVPPERKEDITVVVAEPLKDAAVVVAAGGGRKSRGGRLGAAPGGAWLVLRLADGASDAAPRFEGSANVVMAQTPVTLDDCCVQAE